MLLKYILRFLIIAILATVIANLFDIDIQWQTITTIFNTIIALGMASFVTIYRKCKQEDPCFYNPIAYKSIDRINRYNFSCAFINFFLLFLFLLFGIKKFTVNDLVIDIMFISWLHLIVILFYYIYFLYKLSNILNRNL